MRILTLKYPGRLMDENRTKTLGIVGLKSPDDKLDWGVVLDSCGVSPMSRYK